MFFRKERNKIQSWRQLSDLGDGGSNIQRRGLPHNIHYTGQLVFLYNLKLHNFVKYVCLKLEVLDVLSGI